MRCPRCQHDNFPGGHFCTECATPLLGNCALCSTSLPTGAKFCPRCAHPVGSSPLTSVVPTKTLAKFEAPAAYTPTHLAERIRALARDIEGERKLVTVLFADLRGSTELIADRDAEEGQKLLAPVLEAMIEVVHHYEGTVNRVMGDGIFALFGAPLAHEDHALRACLAALLMQDAVRRHGRSARPDLGPELQIRVGLNSGGHLVHSAPEIGPRQPAETRSRRSHVR